MYLYERIFIAIRGWFKRKPVKNFTLEVDTLHTLKRIAKVAQTSPEEVADQILEGAFRNMELEEENRLRWNSLSPREREVAALICLRYTGGQIAAKLNISPQTVRTHAEHILLKFNVPNREELRVMLKDWDFSEWDK